jgi:hypothetical protein
MANFKTLRAKEKKYVFRVFGNEKAKDPAAVLFSCFPHADEVYMMGDRKDISEGVASLSLDTPEGREKAVDRMVGNLLNNMAASKINYEAFARECIGGFERFGYEDGWINTVDEFLQKFPPEAARKILQDCYRYAKTEDEFTMGESTA